MVRISSKKVILSILFGSGVGLIVLLYNGNSSIQKHQLTCYPDARLVNGVYVEVFRLTQNVYSVEIRNKNGGLTMEGYVNFKNDDKLDNYDIISYDERNGIGIKDGSFLNIRDKR
ncbi:hypothetical protein [Entomohabitans teleogrylli]|uniref:hypothetical protein n=1 Tax=Entomohabitans teleogrylli TaxID=1384589 RepID=UPI00073D3603|nr:hypothetical protein [Entomohabitans teleogrylli]